MKFLVFVMGLGVGPELVWALESGSGHVTYAPPTVLTWTTGIQIVLSLGLVLALMAGVAWALKKFQWASSSAGKGRQSLRIVSSLAVGQRERVVVVEVQDTWVVVGVAPGQVQTLHILPRPGGKDRELEG
ncbi:flagellar biosynthetic protein FliO [Ferrovum myxofaciens]|jgi:flagellar protein FliO/FliZ|uniref:Flagellar protein n=2 Tax=root TaxID=1 RepID=A0A8F3DVW0_9PROT|nr:flagellar biosynthetic protein FliO [Ferrovum myxofaciens]MBW8028182.1 flagellar biosynthetic protein FliO [Ferrovum sp.]KXW58376.1 flagellar protein FliO [Ferrovum myxofaciens]MBU6994705.1 flagellar biosynthetic protein FliO [Ferrovum myxofaciens]NDU88792.1 flagellar biosynthetic protein FliO [Ferrovum sp.]QKE38553.1 MAG: flagellar biosynthetic protein FliO [Ferrovum myxofaciens]